MTKSSTSTTPLGSITHDKVVSNRAVSHRLSKKKDGGLILQGAFRCCDGETYGYEWRDIPTVEVD